MLLYCAEEQEERGRGRGGGGSGGGKEEEEEEEEDYDDDGDHAYHFSIFRSDGGNWRSVAGRHSKFGTQMDL
jgi:hypothetical protein